MQRPAKPLTPVRFRIQPPLNIMKIGIIGYGFVGKALEAGFTDAVKILKIDPKLNSKIDDLIDFDPDAIFMLRGNHETKNMNKIYGFEGEILHKYVFHLHSKPLHFLFQVKE